MPPSGEFAYEALYKKYPRGFIKVEACVSVTEATRAHDKRLSTGTCSLMQVAIPPQTSKVLPCELDYIDLRARCKPNESRLKCNL
ncbi:hypothetical protein RSAG8_00632, partial [Rhizoctonia solani AG-8 WAC10335]